MLRGLSTYLATCALPASILAFQPARWLGIVLVTAFALAVVGWPGRGRTNYVPHKPRLRLNELSNSANDRPDEPAEGERA